MVAADAHFIPKNGNKQHLPTWQSNSEGIQNQLGYIMISNKHRNWDTQVGKGTSTLNIDYRRKLILTKIKIRFKRYKLTH